MIQPPVAAGAEHHCRRNRNRRLARAVELSLRGATLLGESNALLRRIAEISQRTISANYQYTQLLLDWSNNQHQHPLQARHDRQASQQAARRIARQASRAALDIAALVDNLAPAWRRGIADAAPPPAANLSQLAARVLAVACQVERLARLPSPAQHELAALARSMQGMREIAQRNIQIAQRAAASVERILREALHFSRRLAQP
nr:hypothetical protein [uncultured Duganella sp.]